jgi:Holliday junction resolvase RusA-like endonuclease
MLRFLVTGEPRPQGSMTAVYNRRLKVARVRHVAAPALSAWRVEVANAARHAGAEKWTGPIGLRISFAIKPPIDRRHGYPKSPDLDKLVRAVMDALTGVCYVDDSQVVKLRTSKSWRAVTVIEVWQIERQSARAQQTLW